MGAVDSDFEVVMAGEAQDDMEDNPKRYAVMVYHKPLRLWIDMSVSVKFCTYRLSEEAFANFRLMPVITRILSALCFIRFKSNSSQRPLSRSARKLLAKLTPTRASPCHGHSSTSSPSRL